MNYFKLKYFIPFCLIFVLSCSKDDNTSSENQSETEIQGNWMTYCYLNDNDSNTWKYEKNTININNSDFELKKEFFSNINCLSRTVTITEHFSNLQIGQEVTYESGNVGKKFTYDVVSFKRVVHTESLVNNYNSWIYCGFNDWVLNQIKDYTGQSCGNSNPTFYPVKNTTIFNQYLLYGNNLKLGPNSSSNYPNKVNNTPIYIKQ